MGKSLRKKLDEEIDQIPEAQLSAVYEIIHRFRLSQQKVGPQDVMPFAGAWNDMPEETFEMIANRHARRSR
jgi:hypothetical protein